MIQIEVLRGEHVESVHNCSVAVVDADGHAAAEFGDIYNPIFPRSAVKLMQALPLVESGAAEHFQLDALDLALCCSSHAGEDHHAERAKAILASAGLTEAALQCGASWPSEKEPAMRYAASGGYPRPLRHCCSGKHAGFLCLACHLEADTASYLEPTNSVQEQISATLQEVTAYEFLQPPEIDGCSALTHAIPLKELAFGFARLATGQGISVAKAKAAKQLLQACMDHPNLVGGDKCYDSLLMAGGTGKVFGKFGAEGVFCGALPELGLGIAVKCHDGTKRAAEIAFGTAVMAFHETVMEHQDVRPIINAAGTEVGSIRQSGNCYK